MGVTTEQELFWQGDFGDDYASRNRGSRWVANNAALFADVFRHTSGIGSVLELGASIGLNLLAIQGLLPMAALSAVEINQQAALELARHLPDAAIHQGSILEFEPPRTYDLVFTKGVLIHLDPETLPKVYGLIYGATKRYVLLAEYYNPMPVEVVYRGHEGRLFKRDFAGEMMDTFSDLRLIDYGFVYHRDPSFPQDDVSWFLMEKK